MSGIVKLNAMNDRNGNPRRCYIVAGKQGLIAVVEEGYGDAKKIAERLSGGAWAAVEMPTTPSALKALYKKAKAAGIFYSD